MSSRPLNVEDFIRDDYVMPESALPPAFELDTIYQFIMGSETDSSSSTNAIRTNDIIQITIKNMQSSSETGHAFIIDNGKDKFHLNATYRFEMDRWVEAICISMQTAREAKLSLTGACKNISKIVSEYDFNMQRLIDQITEENNKKLPLEVTEWDADVELIL